MEERPITPRSDSYYKNKMNIDPLLHKKYFLKYRTIKKIGEGSFGKVYKAEYNNELYAVKFEEKDSGQNLLETESAIMDYLRGPYIPKIKTYGYNEKYYILVMDLMGRSLEKIFNINKKKSFSVKTTALLAYKIISILKYIHDRHIIHRDIKPDNFVVGRNEDNANLFLLDFGLAKKFRSSKTLEHYPYIKKKKLTGTARYASIHALEEMEQSRRDDLEGACYVLIYFLRGNLPWMGMKIKGKEDKIKKILDKKKEVTPTELCKDFPEEFRDFLEYCRNLGYSEEPEYDKYKIKFYDLVTKKLGEKFDYIYDWTTEIDLQRRMGINKKENNKEENEKKEKEDKEKKEKEKAEKKQKDEKNQNFRNILQLFNDNANDNGIHKENILDLNEIKDKKINDKTDLRCCIM